MTLTGVRRSSLKVDSVEPWSGLEEATECQACIHSLSAFGCRVTSCFKFLS